MVWFVLLLAFFPSVLAKGSCEDKLRECEARNPSRAVCGSDGKTYPTRCHLLKARCAGDPALAVVQVGSCSDEQPCFAEQEARKGEVGLDFVPKCLPSGQYAPIQCHEGTGYCWCVTPQGKPLSNTSVKNSTPVCVTHKQRRDPMRREHKHRKACRKIDRTKLINNLVRIFKVEFNRTDMLPASGNETELEKMGVEWKFGTLDMNSNKNLTLNEYQELKKLVRKAVKPKKCSKNFINICDKDKDATITYQEWTNCLVKKPIAKKFKDKKKKSSSKVGSPHLSPGLPGLLNERVSPVEEVPPEKKDEPEVSDCLTDRKNVLGELTEIHFELFIPECTADGRYEKTQCYKSTGYCWCVNEDSGKPIPGTSRKYINPKCDTLQLPMRPMKGCPEQKKIMFLNELREFFIKKYPSSSDPTGEQFAIWTFQVIDTSKNKFLDKKEMGPLRTLLLSFSPNVKRCGKKFARYCDVNHDKKISLTEWVNCLDTESSAVGMTVTQSPKRKGPNPLETILKPDDYD
ncbi:unnamed protein product [Nezara viridula]|uniref:SPARC-related modular calcium-binding protein 1 n=1 Tax=Nezara viridula TaxID=85310 RepID=A0A9P0H3D5_NEZVI|nr:unnamed protein product [Nezara viridula]